MVRWIYLWLRELLQQGIADWLWNRQFELENKRRDLPEGSQALLKVDNRQRRAKNWFDKANYRLHQIQKQRGVR